MLLYCTSVSDTDKNYSNIQYIKAGGRRRLGFEYLILEDFELSVM
jgi:hypothetical protein